MCILGKQVYRFFVSLLISWGGWHPFYLDCSVAHGTFNVFSIQNSHTLAINAAANAGG